jgi:AcrR family transcriptional regulator
MPKKPFSAEEVAWQRERIMDSAANVMADMGFHALSMRKLAASLAMTASNIYNYFPGKESLLLHIRRRGFELLFQEVNRGLREGHRGGGLVQTFVQQLIRFSLEYPGYYQLMFQPPKADQVILVAEDQGVALQLERLLEEWQRHAMVVLEDTQPDMSRLSESERQRLTLFFLTSIHGLVDCYHYRALPMLMDGVDLIPEEMVQTHIRWLLSALSQALPVSV